MSARPPVEQAGEGVRTAWLPIEQAADACGEMAWLTDALFRTWGRWSTDEPEPAARVHWAVSSRRHGSHATAWVALLPTSPQLGAAERIRPTAGWREAFAALGAAPPATAPPDTATRLAVATDVILPRLVDGLRDLLDRSGDVADAPLRRAARAHLADVADEAAAATDVAERLGGHIDRAFLEALAGGLAAAAAAGGDS